MTCPALAIRVFVLLYRLITFNFHGATAFVHKLAVLIV